jgi:hypothetical protein
VFFSFPYFLRPELTQASGSQRDNRRRNYLLKESKLSRALIKAMDLPAMSDSALALDRWKVPPGKGDTRVSALYILSAAGGELS